jgi:hypothetical protein
MKIKSWAQIKGSISYRCHTFARWNFIRVLLSTPGYNLQKRVLELINNTKLQINK